MKKLFKIFILYALILSGIWSCKKEENRVLFTGGTAPVLTASLTDNIPLSFATKDNEALKLSWTNPDYQFNTGISSLNVNYNIEIDTVGANFTNPNKKVLSLGTDLTKTFTQSEFNDYLLNQLQLTPGSSHDIEIRITSFLVGGAEPLVSNVSQFAVTPFAIPPKVASPATGKLFITGSATPASWQCGCGEPELGSQTFTRLSNTLFELTINLTGGGSYLFLPQYGSWSAKYGGTGANNTNNVNGDDFKPDGGDLLAPAAGGSYKIQVDFQRGKFTVTKL
jgi:hypothetical protein